MLFSGARQKPRSGEVAPPARRAARAVWAVLVLVAVAVIGGTVRAQDTAPLPAPTPERVPETVPEKEPADPAASTPIAAGDGLQVFVFDHPEFSRSVPVQADGAIIYLPIGRLHVAGQTVDALAGLIALRLEAEFKLREPRVLVAVESVGQRAVYILGQVRSPGSQSLPSTRPLTLTQLVALSGGFQAGADLSRISIQHSDGSPVQHEYVDLTALKVSGFSENNVRLRDGDTIYVPVLPAQGSISILGQVASPGSFALRSEETTTLLRALALARGLTRLADHDDVVLIRDAPAGRVRTTYDVDKIIDGEADDPLLEDGDILVVGERGW